MEIMKFWYLKEDDEKKWVSNPKLSPDENYIVFETSYSVQVN